MRPSPMAARSLDCRAMCCFSRPVQSVSATSIFARPIAGGRQALAYAMAYQATEDLALILPIAVPPGAGEGAVEWIDLSACGDLFDRLDRAFPRAEVSRGAPPAPQAGAPATLRVARVGSFEASFAPTGAELARLDPRFRLPQDVIDRLPVEGDRGFVVAQLRADATAMHPLAFTFPRADPAAVFFPTIHVHDGEVHATAEFDHTLVLQAAGLPAVASADEDGPLERLAGAVRRLVGQGGSLGDGPWERATRPASDVLDPATTGGLVDPDLPLARLRLHGDLPNEDVLVRLP